MPARPDTDDDADVGAGPVVRVPIRGLDRVGVIAALDAKGVQRNTHAETLLASLDFDALPVGVLTVTERTVADLGFDDGATLSQILAAAQEQRLQPAQIEAAPFIALVIEQPFEATGSIESTGSAPVGSLTIAAHPPTSDPAFPTGYYLRALDGVRWLRGYRCDADYRFSPGDRFLFDVASG